MSHDQWPEDNKSNKTTTGPTVDIVVLLMVANRSPCIKVVKWANIDIGIEMIVKKVISIVSNQELWYIHHYMI